MGGSFHLSDADRQRPLLFIAGGIGITPIASMAAHLVTAPGQAQRRQPAALLLYSASTADELVFKQELLDLAERSQGGDLACINPTYVVNVHHFAYILRESKRHVHALWCWQEDWACSCMSRGNVDKLLACATTASE